MDSTNQKGVLPAKCWINQLRIGMYQNDHLTRTCPKRVLISVLLFSMLCWRPRHVVASQLCIDYFEGLLAMRGGIGAGNLPQLISTTGWWFGTFGLFFPYIGNNHPKWLIIFFRGVGIPPIRKWWRIAKGWRRLLNAPWWSPAGLLAKRRSGTASSTRALYSGISKEPSSRWYISKSTCCTTDSIQCQKRLSSLLGNKSHCLQSDMVYFFKMFN